MAKNSTKDKEMAAYLRAKKVARDSGRCVICGKMILNRETEAHIGIHARSGN